MLSILAFGLSLSKNDIEALRISHQAITRLNDFISENETAGYCLEFSSKVSPEQMKVILKHEEGKDFDGLDIKRPYKKFAINCVQGHAENSKQDNNAKVDEPMKLSKSELEFIKDQTFGLLNRYEELVLVETLGIGDGCLIRKQQGTNLFNRKPQIMKVLELYKQSTGQNEPPVPELVSFLSESKNKNC